MKSRIRLALPNYTIENNDGASQRVIDAIQDAMGMLTKAPEFSAKHICDLETAKALGFYKTERGPYWWSMNLGYILHRILAEMLDVATRRRINVDLHCGLDRPGTIRVEIQQLRQVKRNIFCSPKLPTIKLPSGENIVAYYFFDDDHFVRRLEERTVAAPDHYLSKGQVFACLYRWQYFDPVRLPNGQYAARLWNWCDPKLDIGELWMELAGPDKEVATIWQNGVQFVVRNGVRAHYLVGYCPIDERDISNGYVVLKTLLLPGMDNTPEFAKMQTHAKDTVARCNLQKEAAKLTMKHLYEHRNYDLIREFHRFSPQVKFIDEEVFDYGVNWKSE